MAPTVSWYEVTGGTPSYALITKLSYGNVQAGYWSPAKSIVAKFVGDSANTLKFWLNDTASTGGNTDVSAAASWKHTYLIDDDYLDPATVTDSTKNGWDVLEEVQPTSSNFVTSSLSDGDYTDFINLAVQPPGSAGDGLTKDWGYRLSFLYP